MVKAWTTREKNRIMKRYAMREWFDEVYGIRFLSFRHVPLDSTDPLDYINNEFLKGKIAEYDIDPQDFVLTDAGTTAKFLNDDLPLHLVVFLFEDAKPLSSAVAHEAFHGARCVLDRAGVGDEEAIAYYVGYLVKNIAE